MKYEHESMANGVNMWSTDGKAVILGSLIKTAAFWGKGTKCSYWLSANGTVNTNDTSNFLVF